MSIEVPCEHCGKIVRAPRELAGKQGKCPGCGNAVYIPTPLEEIEELPLVPEDTSAARREAELQAERRRLDGLLAREESSLDDQASGRSAGRSSPSTANESSPPGRSSHATGSPGTGSTRTERAVIAYLVAMRDTDLEAADKAVAALNLQPRVAKELIDRLAADQLPPPEMTGVPSGVYQGFLKTLRSRL